MVVQHQIPFICQLLLDEGQSSTATYIRRQLYSLDKDAILGLLESPKRSLHLPLFCLLQTLNVSEDNELHRLAVDELQDIIFSFQSLKKLEDWQAGQVLDRILSYQMKNGTFSTVEDLCRLFTLLQHPSWDRILEALEKSTPNNDFWKNAFEIALDHRVNIPSKVFRLFMQTDFNSLMDFFRHADSGHVKGFLQDLNSIQNCSYPLSVDEWNSAVSDRPKLHSLYHRILEALALKWIIGDREQHDISHLRMQVYGTVGALIEEYGWRFDDFSKLFSISVEEQALPNLLSILASIYENKLPSSSLDQLDGSDPLQVDDVQKFHDKNLEFEPSAEISREEAIRRIVNSDFMRDNHAEAKITEDSIRQSLEDFDETYKTVKNGAANKSVKSLPFEYEAAAVIAVEKFNKVQLRDVQKIAVILGSQARRAAVSRLLQMQTGEGKTFVVASLAIAEAKRGHKVDIITSSSTLATTQCEELRKLYQSEGLSVQHNCSGTAQEKEDQEIYKADVLYGNPASFMFDVIYEEFWGKKLRHGRGFQVAIVDEADSQLLDNRFHQCIISTNASGMGNLMSVQAIIWMLVAPQFKNLKKQEDGSWKMTSEEGEAVFNHDEELKKFFSTSLLEAAQKAIGHNSDSDHVDYPATLESLVKTELPHWIDSAVSAFLKRRDFDYVLENDEVVIVDSGNTGSRHPGMRWSYGLHQFLEMLNGTHFDAEGLTTCYLSTVSFCLRYKTNLLGLTGTVGGPASRKFMKNVYNVDFVEIPPFKVWRHINLSHVLCHSEEQWINKVVQSVIEKLHDGRAVLLITQYIFYANVFYRKLSERMGSKIMHFTGGGDDASTGDKLQAGTCIVATNIAGRGTDLKIADEVEERGGLHVVLSSFPENDRVERQNIGRASRTGQRGTSQMILYADHLPDFMLADMVIRTGGFESHTILVESLKEIRDEYVMSAIDQAILHVDYYKKADEGLASFIAFRDKIIESGEKDQDGKKTYTWQRVEQSLNTQFGKFLSQLNKYPTPEDVKTHFGKLEEAKEIHEYFDDYVLPVNTSWSLKWNPREESFKTAWKLACRAVDIDPKFSGAAYYVKGLLFLWAYCEFGRKSNVENAIKEFAQCRDVVERLRNQYELMVATTARKGESKTKLQGQMTRLMMICDTITGNVNGLIGRDVESEIQNLQKLIGDGRKTGADVSKFEEEVKQLNENRESLKNGLLKTIIDNDSSLEIKTSRLIEFLPDSVKKEDYQKEIDVLNDDGYLYLASIKEKKKSNFWNWLAVTALGLLQLIGGALLVAFTGGIAATIGVDLMIEGCIDLYTAVKRCIIDGDFNWKEYGEQKLIGVLISVVTLGMGGLKAAFKGLSKGTQAIAKTALKTTGTQVAKQGLKHAGKQATKIVLKTGARVCSEFSKTPFLFPIGVYESLDYIAGDPIRGAVSHVLRQAIKEALNGKLRQNGNVHTLVDRDNHNNDKHYTEQFITRAFEDFLSKIDKSFMEQVQNGLGVGAQQNLAGKGKRGAVQAIQLAMSFVKATVFVSKLVEYFQNFDRILEDLANGLPSKSGTERHEGRVYEETSSSISVDSVIGDLATKIADIFAQKTVAHQLSKLASSVANNAIERAFKKSTGELEHYKKAFVHSDEVVKNAERLKNSQPNDKLVANVADHLIKIAKNSEMPGDRVQAKQLAEIEHVGSDGKKKVTRLGGQFSKNAPIRLKYEEGNGAVGHYSSLDGKTVIPHGKNTCLFDSVAIASNYDVLNLKKANFMLHDVNRVGISYLNSDYTDLLVGGARSRRVTARQQSVFADRHVSESPQTIEDVLVAAVKGQNTRKSYQRVHSVVDENKDYFDGRADSHYDWIRPPRYTNVTYSHDESNIYLTRWNGNAPYRVDAFRGEPHTLVDFWSGAFHLDSKNTPQNTSVVKIWQAGQPTTTRIEDVWPDYQ